MVGIKVALKISVKSCLYKKGTIKYTSITMHKYFTATAKASREAKKQKNLEEVKERLERNIYED
jgi:hypothetical protein